MKAKKIQRKHPTENNKLKRLIKGTKLQEKAQKKKKSRRNTDPNAYLEVKKIEFDPFDLRGRTTLKASL
jgi:hypothetical protein